AGGGPALRRRHAVDHTGPRLFHHESLALRGGARPPRPENHRERHQGARGRPGVVLVQQRLSSVSREPLALQEFALLMADPVFYGVGVPRGDGRPALVLPGLFANDFYLQPMHSWLGRIGYRPVPSTFWVNAGCPEGLTVQAQGARARRISRTATTAV